jgi:hypothetical protein
MRIGCSIEGVSQEVLRYPPRAGREVRDSLSGSVSAIVDRLGVYQELGVRHLVIETSTQSHAGTAATLDAFMTRIAPQLRP